MSSSIRDAESSHMFSSEGRAGMSRMRFRSDIISDARICQWLRISNLDAVGCESVPYLITLNEEEWGEISDVVCPSRLVLR
jgi:hypothetical protein